MSSTALNWAKGVTIGGANRKAVLLILADYCDEEWSCFPSQSRIAEEAEVGERTVRRILAEWEADGVIRRERRPSKDGSGRSSDRIYIQPASVAARKPPCEKFQAANLTFQAANRDVSTGQSLAGEPPVEPPVENLVLTLADASSHPDDIDDDFEEWWQAYPKNRRVGKAEAKLEYTRARRIVDAEELLTAVTAFARLHKAQATEAKFIPHACRWLKRRRWEDEEPEARDPFQGPEMRFG